MKKEQPGHTWKVKFKVMRGFFRIYDQYGSWFADLNIYQDVEAFLKPHMKENDVIAYY